MSIIGIMDSPLFVEFTSHWYHLKYGCIAYWPLMIHSVCDGIFVKVVVGISRS